MRWRLIFHGLILAAAANAGVMTDGRGELICTVENAGEAPKAFQVPAGAVYATGSGERLVSLRQAELTVPAHGTGEMKVPAAALSLQATRLTTPEPACAVDLLEPRLAPLWPFLATQPDLPRATSQCLVLAVTEDLDFAQWLAVQGPGVKPEEALAEAVDALAILKTLWPAKPFRLAQDAELKVRALRQPATRGKAALVYGLTLPGDPPPGAVPPNLGQLLHTKPGDNCPICRMRAQMQAPASDL